MSGKLKRFVCGLVLWAVMDAAVALKAADFFKICHTSDAKFKECVISSVHDLRPSLKSGLTEIGMASVEPLVIPKMTISQGSGPVSIKSTFVDTHVDGITNFVIKSLKVDLDNFKIDATVTIPWLYVSGDYEMNGRILVLPITGKGDSWSNYTGVVVTLAMQGHQEIRDGKNYMKLDTFKFGLNVKKAVVTLNNLFGGNKQLGNVMNQFLSNNWALFFAEIKPVVDKEVGIILKQSIDKVFDSFPYEELFPK